MTGCAQGRDDFCRVMAIVVYDQDAVSFALHLEPAVRILECSQGSSYLFERNLQLQAGGGGRQRVQNSMLPRHAKLKRSEGISLVPHIAARAEVLELDMGCNQIRLVTGPIGHDPPLNLRNDRLNVWVVKAQHGCTVKRDFVHKGD